MPDSRTTKANNWRRHLWLFPLISGTVWLSTLLTLLVYWLAAGRPRLPLQSNPYIAFISDIGASHLKPLFITGCTITALTYMGTIFSVHHARYSSHMYALADEHNTNNENDDLFSGGKNRKIFSGLALLGGLVACAALLLLAIFDTYRFHTIHGRLLLICFGGLGTSMVSTTVVWFDQAWKPSRFGRLRGWCILSNALVLLEVLLGAIFTAMEWTSHYRIAGIIEWILTFIGGFYLICFVGYLWRACEYEDSTTTKQDVCDGEREPLLTSASLSSS